MGMFCVLDFSVLLQRGELLVLGRLLLRLYRAMARLLRLHVEVDFFALRLDLRRVVLRLVELRRARRQFLVHRGDLPGRRSSPAVRAATRTSRSCKTKSASTVGFIMVVGTQITCRPARSLF